MRMSPTLRLIMECLNESPSEKEGKFYRFPFAIVQLSGLNESPSEKEGKSSDSCAPRAFPRPQ